VATVRCSKIPSNSTDVLALSSLSSSIHNPAVDLVCSHSWKINK
jgi:hypothetical protein